MCTLRRYVCVYISFHMHFEQNFLIKSFKNQTKKGWPWHIFCCFQISYSFSLDKINSNNTQRMGTANLCNAEYKQSVYMALVVCVCVCVCAMHIITDTVVRVCHCVSFRQHLLWHDFFIHSPGANNLTLFPANQRAYTTQLVWYLYDILGSADK